MKFWKTLSNTGKRLSNSHKNNSSCNAASEGGVAGNGTTSVLSSVSTTPALMRRRTANGNRQVGPENGIRLLKDKPKNLISLTLMS